ncbi:MAG: hypothetical protein Q8O67_09685 [Deltaproteobacteria bacterium]|nr:hypothetical protein [Deltaproteobacteria bacterium]
MSLAVVVVVGAVASALWPGLGEEIVVDGGRSPAEIEGVVARLLPELERCVQAGPLAKRLFDVVVEVKIGGQGGVLGSAAVILSPGARAHLSLTCVSGVLETATFKDRGLEPPTHALLRFTDDDDPAALPIEGLRKVLRRRQGAIARCVRRARFELPELRGVVTATLTFETDGDAVVDVDGSHPRLRGCVLEGLAGLALDGFPGPRIVTAPFVFDDVPPADARTRPPWEHATLASWLGCDLFL